ncbi:MAG TPA: hypothetical protein P5572_14425 [Phycisphaerae bacterium]|nr:hypothetical protein [Phycisphaerales bacterium]HRX86212.1 hypothetical protein [Phycisphaerae bacterium]
MPTDPFAAQPFRARLATWSIICFISAVPSFFWAIGTFDTLGMLCGIAVFILAYACVSGAPAVRRMYARPFVARTVRIGYGTRLFLSIAFPLGAGVDLYFGMVSTSIGSALSTDPQGFSATLLTTLVQGTLLNLALGVYMAIIYGVQRLFMRYPPPAGCCAHCGYDLRASPQRCPECGTPVSVRASA